VLRRLGRRRVLNPAGNANVSVHAPDY
jgi:hypothetical protein